jgi:hypothetical protein
MSELAIYGASTMESVLRVSEQRAAQASHYRQRDLRARRLLARALHPHGVVDVGLRQEIERVLAGGDHGEV